jgi:transposase
MVNRFGRFTMGAGIALRGDFEAADLRRLAKASKDAGQSRRLDRKAPGVAPKLNDAQRRALAEIVEQGPIPAIHRVVRWRLKDLAQWIWDEFRTSLDETTVGRELKAMGFAKMTARPRHHGQNELAIEDFKKTSLPSWQRSTSASRAVSR